MKFLCDNCKAKYQIADEKVAGKTVRMKCRKCGHQIEVRAAVTETSAASHPPRAPMGAPAAPRPMAPRSGLATSLSATKPRAPTPSTAPSPLSGLAGAFNRNVQDAPASMAGGAIGSVGARSSSTIELSVTDEWYVAINGVPVGPVRISELRRKAAAGAVTEESLCWQEGLEEWRPIRSIPDLAALVREAAQGNRPSLLGTPQPEPAAQRPSILPSAPRQPAATPSFQAPRVGTAGTAPPPPRPMSPSSPSPQIGPGRSNVVPLRPAASSGIDEIGFGGSAAAAYAPSLMPQQQQQPAPMFQAPQPLQQPLSSPMMPLAPAHDPFAVPPGPVPSPLSPYPNRESGISQSMMPPAPPLQPSPSMYIDQGKRGVPLWFWPILVVALGFGGGVAFLVFRPPQTPAPVVIQMPSTATAAPTNPNTDIPPPNVSSEPSAATPETKPAGNGKVAARKPPTTPEEKKGLDLGGLVPGGGGPNVGPNNAGPAGGGGLDQAGVERVVAQHRNGVKRTCWERGGADQKSSVNVTVTANVAPNGSVASTSSTGDDPVVAKCIESQVKSWQFPAPGASTTINIPFKFVRQ